MLNITKNTNESGLTVALTGRLDTTTAPELEKELKASLDGVTTLVIDMTALDYISSAGLRVLLSAQKAMNKQGEMKVVHVNETIMEIFEVTGFSDILTIK
jgi:anti-sigma B factor antagonist